MSTIGERWIVRRAPAGGGWEARHCPPRTSYFDEQNAGHAFGSFAEAHTAVPAEFCQAIGPRDPETKEGAEARVMFMRAGDWELALRDAGIDPTRWFETGEHWRCRARKYRCRYPGKCANDGMGRHYYEIVAADEPDAPGRCNDDPGEDPDWKSAPLTLSLDCSRAIEDGVRAFWEAADRDRARAAVMKLRSGEALKAAYGDGDR